MGLGWWVLLFLCKNRFGCKFVFCLSHRFVDYFFIFFWCVMTFSPWPVVLCKPLALWLSAINYTVIWHRAPESPLGPLLHACSLIKVQGLVSADNSVRLALICWADDPGISSQSSDWFQGKAKQNTGQSVSVYSGLLDHDYYFVWEYLVTIVCENLC